MTRSRQLAAWAVLGIPIIVTVVFALASVLRGFRLPMGNVVSAASLVNSDPGQTDTPTPSAGLNLVFNASSAQIAQQPSATPINGAGTPATHIVSRGDTLYALSIRYGLRIQDIALYNNLVDLNNLRLGQQLFIPPGTLTPTQPQATLPVVNLTPLVLLTSSPTPLPPTLTSTATSTPTITDTPSNTPIPTETLTPTPSDTPGPTIDPTILAGATIIIVTSPPTPTVAPTYPPLPSALNEISIRDFVPLDRATRANILAIFAEGQRLNRNPRAFSKVGDSTVESPFFMDRFDQPGTYNLAEWAGLQPTINWFAGSFNRNSIAVHVGLHTWSVFDPMWADPYQCEGGESVFECEIRIHNPAFIIIRLGANDVGVPGYVEDNFRRMIEFASENGVVPILGTKGDRHEGSNINNEIIYRLGEEYHIPIWDYDLLAATIPGRGLLSDGAHMTTFYAHDWSQPYAYQTGHGVHTLAGLIMLDQMRRLVEDQVEIEATAELTPEATIELIPPVSPTPTSEIA